MSTTQRLRASRSAQSRLCTRVNCRHRRPWLLSPPCSGSRAMTTPDDGPAPDHQEGDAADTIRSAEVALAHQNSTTAQIDLQVVTAVLNAHQKAAASRDALNTLQRDIEGAVATRSDLDTPAGARDFQRYLIGKLRDIQAVVAGASLDDTSNSALMAAWTSLYNSSQADAVDSADDRHPPTAAPRLRRYRPPSKRSLHQRNPTSIHMPIRLPGGRSRASNRSGAGQVAAHPRGGRDAEHSLPRRGRPAERRRRFGMPGGFPLGGSSPEELSPAGPRRRAAGVRRSREPAGVRR